MGNSQPCLGTHQLCYLWRRSCRHVSHYESISESRATLFSSYRWPSFGGSHSYCGSLRISNDAILSADHQSRRQICASSVCPPSSLLLEFICQPDLGPRLSEYHSFSGDSSGVIDKNRRRCVRSSDDYFTRQLYCYFNYCSDTWSFPDRAKVASNKFYPIFLIHYFRASTTRRIILVDFLFRKFCCQVCQDEEGLDFELEVDLQAAYSHYAMTVDNAG
jgi:hypothetical protein